MQCVQVCTLSGCCLRPGFRLVTSPGYMIINVLVYYNCYQCYEIARNYSLRVGITATAKGCKCDQGGPFWLSACDLLGVSATN